MKMTKRFLALLLTLTLLISALPAALAAGEADMTRGAVADYLLAAADDYNPSVKRGDILKGYPNGDLDEDGGVTRAQALVMLERAFGGLPEPKGDNARSGYPAANFTDVPAWAAEELKSVFASGIVAGTSATTFSPNAPVTEAQMKLFVARTYALEGTNLKDDFYATVNKQALDASVIQPGYTGAGGFVDLGTAVSSDVAAIIREIAGGATKTPSEKKIANLYNNILNMDARNAAGIAPIKKYLDAVTAADSLDKLMQTHAMIYDEMCSSLLVGFSLTVDAKDSNVYDLTFGSISPSLGQAGYATATDTQKAAYIKYLTTMLKLVGESDAQAAADAQRIWNMEADIASKSLPSQEYGNVDKTYNVFTMAELQKIYPNVDLSAVFARSGLTQTDKIVIADVGGLRAAAAYFTPEHLDDLKALCMLNLASTGIMLNQEFTDASDTLNQEYLGVSGTVPLETTAASYVQSLMSDYLGEAYVARHFSAAAKTDVESMVRGILEVYESRIKNLTWMSETTKQKAIRKLSTMKLHIGYPDKWENDLDGVEIRSVAEGGSFYENLTNIRFANRAKVIGLQKKNVDKDQWGMAPFTVNAEYIASTNTIEFPAGILQPPFYDVNAAYEQNLGSIGYVIAHEITHAFDNNGAKYDENGNAADWWTAEDYAAFQGLCEKVVVLYDGAEAAPGITCNGVLTLSENIADLGAMACITQLEAKQKTPDYKVLYTAAGKIWYSTYTREMKQYLTTADVHSPDKLRGSLVLQNFAEFYEAFSIGEGDGMYLAPENRVTIW